MGNCAAKPPPVSTLKEPPSALEVIIKQLDTASQLKDIQHKLEPF
jgi:hypothetical protein